MSPITVIIVDDERSARNEIQRALLPYPDFEAIGEAKNADEAQAAIEAKKPDLIFLDIKMPEKTGFDLLSSLTFIPEVVFTTAFDQYAIQAFDKNALDYLLKPIREERFEQALEKIRQRFLVKDTMDKQDHFDKKIFIKDGEKCHFVHWHEVYLIESLGNYARFYFNDKKALFKSSLDQLEEKLDEKRFFRINRAQIVNAEYISSVQALAGGKLILSLVQGPQLEVSNRQSVKFKTWYKV